MELTDKGRATLQLARENAATGGDTHCWCEGGDTGDFEVPDHMQEEVARIIQKRADEAERLGAIARAKMAAEEQRCGAAMIIDNPDTFRSVAYSNDCTDADLDCGKTDYEDNEALFDSVLRPAPVSFGG